METERMRLVQKINRLNVLHRLHIHKQAAKFGLYFGQLPILEFVIAHDLCSQKDLADELHVSPPSIATSVKRMEKAGLLQKAANLEDLRYNRISATEKGRQLAKQCRSAFNEIDDQMFHGLNLEERRQLAAYLDRLVANLSVGEFSDRSFFHLVEEAKKLHVQVRKEERQLD